VTVSLSIIIPTQGRPSLARAVRSCVDAGYQAGDEIIVAVDTHGAAAVGLPPLDLPARVIQWDAGHNCWGHCQINAALDVAWGQYITCQDDDDIYAPGAFGAMRAAASGVPMLFRFQSYHGGIYWDERGSVREHHIGGHCAVFPRDRRLGRYTCRYQGDYDYIRSTLDNWGGDHVATWHDDVIAIARPAEVAA